MPPSPCNRKIATAANRFIAVGKTREVKPACRGENIGPRGTAHEEAREDRDDPRRKREQRRHDIARKAWSDETMSVVQRLQAGLADLRSRLEAERFRRKSRSTLSFHLRKRIKATRDLIGSLKRSAPP